MNKIKFYFFSGLIIALSFLSGCSNIMQRLENPSVHEDVESVLSAIEHEDADLLYEKYFSAMDKDKYIEDFTHMSSMLSGEVTEIRLNNMNSRTYYPKDGDGEKIYTMQSQYIVKTTEKVYILTMSYSGESAEQRKLVGFNFVENLNYIVNYRLADYDAKAWTLFLLNFLSYGIIITALILCIKTKMKKKVLWIILILLQTGYTFAIFPNQISRNFHFATILGISKYQIFAHGGTITTVLFPILAIVFLLVRKSLNRSYLQEQERIAQETIDKEENPAENIDTANEKL